MSFAVSAPMTEMATSLFAITGVPMQVTSPFQRRSGAGMEVVAIPLAVAGSTLADGSASANDNVWFNIVRK